MSCNISQPGQDERFETEMERIDSEIMKTRRQIYSAILGKKRSVTRTWLEISALTNAHILQMLPYKAMLGHVANVAKERDKLIEDMLATKESAEIQEVQSSSDEADLGRESIANARDEAVQTEESSFLKKD